MINLSADKKAALSEAHKVLKVSELLKIYNTGPIYPRGMFEYKNGPNTQARDFASRKHNLLEYMKAHTQNIGHISAL